MIDNRNFLYKLNFLATPPQHDLVDFNGTITFLFLSKNAPNSLAAGAPPQTPLEELTAFYNFLERMEMWGKLNLPPTSIFWLSHCSKFKSRLKFLFKNLKCTKIAGGRCQTPLGELTALPRPLARREGTAIFPLFLEFLDTPLLAIRCILILRDACLLPTSRFKPFLNWS